jgi:beta-ureidopropionase / N-carbamoyl-L-amino-acid hydrolase
MILTLEQINAAGPTEFVQLLDGIYEHSPWVAERAWDQRPFASLTQIEQALARVVRHARRDERLALIRAHPELAGKALVADSLTIESTHEQRKAGLNDCTPEELAKIRQLNAAYRAKFGFPFILAVRGPSGTGLTRAEIIDTFVRRLDNQIDFEFDEALRNIDRIAELRLHDRFGQMT